MSWTWQGNFSHGLTDRNWDSLLVKIQIILPTTEYLKPLRFHIVSDGWCRFKIKANAIGRVDKAFEIVEQLHFATGQIISLNMM